MTETFYEVLGVPPDASQAAIQEAYRDRVKETHPDVSDREDAEDRFKRVKRAEEVLTDPDERAAYDRVGHSAYVDGERAPTDPDVGPVDDEVRAAAARAAEAEHDAGGRSAGWRERERRARRTGRDYWASHVGGFDEDGAAEWIGQGRTRDRNESSDGVDGHRGTRRSDWFRDAAEERSDDASSGTARGADEGFDPRTEPDGWGGETTAGHTYSVRTGSAETGGFGLRRPGWTQDDVALLGATMFLYPIMLFLTVLPSLPLVANVTIGLFTLGYAASLLPRPSIGLAVFGTWSLLVPAVLLGLEVPLYSAVGIVALTGVWLPLLYSVAVAVVLVR